MNWYGQCIEEMECPEGKFYNVEKDKCVRCSDHCNECYYDFFYEEMECSWCEEGYYYDYGFCTKDESYCFDGEFYDYNSGLC